MSKFKDWCQSKIETVNGHDLTVLVADPGSLTKAIAEVAKVVPSHYASGARIANLLSKLGKPAAAKYIKDKLPKSKKIRSGDLGEILGSSYVEEFTDFEMSVNKLRWKDHREMAMRGDDLIGIRASSKETKIRFLKGEVKSAANLSAGTVAKARKALKTYYARPSPHALQFIADRLHEEGDDDLADELDQAILVDGIALSQVSHLIFTFSGNDPSAILKKDVESYGGKVSQLSVGLHVAEHQNFISSVYKKVSP